MNLPVPQPQPTVAAPRRPLGEILLARRALDDPALQSALERQRRSGRRLGELLIARRAAQPRAVAEALAEQWGFGFADLERMPPAPGLIDAGQAEIYLSHRILPWRRGPAGLVHVTDRPEGAASALAALGVPPGPVAVAGSRQIDAALMRLLTATLAERAATRTPAAESVRALDRLRGLALAGFAALTLGALAGGKAGLLVLLGLLLILNAATTLLRLGALVAGLRHPPDAAAEPEDEPSRLPVVTLMVPLYREATMVGEIAAALARLDYPPELLDVKLLLEEDDAETRAAVGAADLPGWIIPIVVPIGAPRTKPRAMNYALDFAEGEVVGILDAEDRPATGQLRDVVRTLAAAPPQVACVQCRLAYYNALENWITRCFQIEYSIWFDVLLAGFQRLGLPIPLGGTSVYFRRSALVDLGGWDAHNVTEDADLGMRLARRGMRCAVVRSVTEEEANCRAGPWIRQRSRWLKGYILTWLSHMRDPARLWRELGPRGFLGLNLLFAGAASAYLAIPLFWLALAIGMVWGHSLWAGTLPGWAVWPVGASLAAGQAVMLGCALLATIRRGTPGLIVWVPTLPVYWTLGAIAAWKAVAEIALAPYYWDKTRHGISRFLRPAAGGSPVRRQQR